MPRPDFQITELTAGPPVGPRSEWGGAGVPDVSESSPPGLLNAEAGESLRVGVVNRSRLLSLFRENFFMAPVCDAVSFLLPQLSLWSLLFPSLFGTLTMLAQRAQPGISPAFWKRVTIVARVHGCRLFIWRT